MTPEQTLLRKVRRMVWFGRLTQACTCLAGACCLWSAIDDWLIGRPLASAIWTTAAFVNGTNFVTVGILSEVWRTLLRQLRLMNTRAR